MMALVRTMCFAAGIAGLTSAAYATHHYYYATCSHESHGYIRYNGRRHADAADAQKDCAAHQKIYPGHQCNIKPVDY